MTAENDRFAELYELAGAQCEGTLSPQQLARLEELVLGDANQRRQYVVYMHTHGRIEEGKHEPEDGKSRSEEQPACGWRVRLFVIRSSSIEPALGPHFPAFHCLASCRQRFVLLCGLGDDPWCRSAGGVGLESVG